MNIYLLVSISIFFLYSLSIACISVTDLTLEEKIGQLMLVSFYGQEVNKEVQQLFTDAQIGGIILYDLKNGLTSVESTRQLTDRLQKTTLNTGKHNIPLWIAIDQEGGLVQRLRTTVYPTQWAIGHNTAYEEQAYKTALKIAQELRNAGIHINCAPVADVATIGVTFEKLCMRCWHTDPTIVTQCCAAALKGYAEAGILAMLKHFPGHGNTPIDSHDGLPTNPRSYEELIRTDLFPFLRLATQTPAIMTAHIMVPAFDPNRCASVSPIILQDLLRIQYYYQGLVFSDSLTMQGITNHCGNLTQAAIQALSAGCDVLCIGGKFLSGNDYNPNHCQEITSIHHALVDAVNAGVIPIKRVNESCQRVLDAKQRFCVQQNK